MPFPNEHSARIKSPEEFTKFARKNIATGIDVILGIKEGKSIVQAYRFKKTEFTGAQAKSWLKEHTISFKSFEPASEKKEDNSMENKIKTDYVEKTWRYDYEVISEKFIDKSTGFLKIPATVTRTGVFVYRKNDGSIMRELRLPKEVFNHDSLDSLKNKPVTNNHPIEMVTLDNAKQLMIGYVSDTIKHDGQFVNTDVIINDKEAIPKIDRGKKQLSCGYTVDLEFKPGVYQGEKYDAIQTNIRYNHVAVVDRGRAGAEACLRLDSNDAEMVSADNNIENDPNKEESMKKIKIDGIEYEVHDDAVAVIEAVIAKRDGLEVKVVELEKVSAETKKNDEVEAMKIKLDESQAKIDAGEAKVKELQEKIDAKPKADPVKEAVRARLDVLKVAEKVCDAETVAKFDEMEDLEIKKASLKAKDPELNLDEKTEVYIDARFDIMKEEMGKADGTKNLGEKIVEGRKDGSKEVDSEEARINAQKHDSEAWKNPCSSSVKNK